jgi:hypothetical protein
MTVIKKSTWAPVASALASFWANSGGPTMSNVKTAIGAGGLEVDDIEHTNKQDLVQKAVNNAPLDLKAKVATELADTLAGEQHFNQSSSWFQEGKVNKLRAAFKDVGGSLLEDGTLVWDEAGDDDKSNTTFTATPTPTETPTKTGGIPSATPVTPPAAADNVWGPSVTTLITVLEELPEAAESLTGPRRKGKGSVAVWDEYDIQDFMKMALRLLYQDVRAEEYNPSMGGVHSRVDFFIKQEQVVVEAKVAYKGHTNKDIGEELIIDIHRYGQRGGVKHLVCVIYDLDGSMKDRPGFEGDYEKLSSDKLRVHVVARRWPFSSRPTNKSASTAD